MPVAPREAASLLLLREDPGSGELEVLMVERSANSAFAGGVYVFPGGMVDEEDCDPAFARHCAGLDQRRAADILGLKDPHSTPRALGFFVAAVRELFEEAGILLAYEGTVKTQEADEASWSQRKGGEGHRAASHGETVSSRQGEGAEGRDVEKHGKTPLRPHGESTCGSTENAALSRASALVSCEGEEGGRLADLRSRLRAGAITFHKMVEEEGLRLALDRLVYFAHWVTPEIMPMRYDTRFFLASAPPCQHPLHDEAETTSLLWISPRRALGLCREGRFPLLPPTVANLWEISQYDTVSQALAAARQKKVTTVRPRFDFKD